MAYFDAVLQYRLFYNVVPAVLVAVIVAKISSSMSLGSRFNAWSMNKFLVRLHKKSSFSKQKDELFKGLLSLHEQRSKTESSKCLNILEIGMGSGLNFQYYPPGSKVMGLDPNPHNEYYIRQNASKAPGVEFVGFIKSFAEDMPQVEDSSFDVVVCTLTLCSVKRPVDVLNEVHRVLKPGGQFYFLEHVAGRPGTFVRKSQDMLYRAWSVALDGCQLNRETWTYFEKSHFKKADITKFSLDTWMMFVLRPFLYGIAKKESE